MAQIDIKVNVREMSRRFNEAARAGGGGFGGAFAGSVLAGAIGGVGVSTVNNFYNIRQARASSTVTQQAGSFTTSRQIFGTSPVAPAEIAESKTVGGFSTVQKGFRVGPTEVQTPKTPTETQQMVERLTAAAKMGVKTTGGEEIQQIVQGLSKTEQQIVGRIFGMDPKKLLKAGKPLPVSLLKELQSIKKGTGLRNIADIQLQGGRQMELFGGPIGLIAGLPQEWPFLKAAAKTHFNAVSKVIGPAANKVSSIAMMGGRRILQTAASAGQAALGPLGSMAIRTAEFLGMSPEALVAGTAIGGAIAIGSQVAINYQNQWKSHFEVESQAAFSERWRSMSATGYNKMARNIQRFDERINKEATERSKAITTFSSQFWSWWGVPNAQGKKSALTNARRLAKAATVRKGYGYYDANLDTSVKVRPGVDVRSAIDDISGGGAYVTDDTFLGTAGRIGRSFVATAWRGWFGEEAFQEKILQAAEKRQLAEAEAYLKGIAIREETASNKYRNLNVSWKMVQEDQSRDWINQQRWPKRGPVIGEYWIPPGG